MRILAIDYGSKKIGLAISNPSGSIAFPFSTINNDKLLLKTLKKIFLTERVEKIVVGLPRYNKKTPLYQELKKFIENLYGALMISIVTHDELLTTQAAKKISERNKNRHDLAAMIILQDYLASTTPHSQTSA